MPRWDNQLQTRTAVQDLKRNAVLKAAGNAFSKKGYHNTSLDDVAADLQVSKGTLYNYVRDKQEILFHCHLLSIEIGKIAFATGTTAGERAADVLQLTLQTFIERLMTELGACGVLMEIDALRPEDRKVVEKERNVFESKLVAILKAGFKDGSIRRTDPRMAIFAFMGAIHWMPRWYSPEGRLSPREVASELTSLLFFGLDPHPINLGTAPPNAPRAPRRRVVG